VSKDAFGTWLLLLFVAGVALLFGRMGVAGLGVAAAGAFKFVLM
jgi:hypothetical protein